MASVVSRRSLCYNANSLGEENLLHDNFFGKKCDRELKPLILAQGTRKGIITSTMHELLDVKESSLLLGQLKCTGHHGDTEITCSWRVTPEP